MKNNLKNFKEEHCLKFLWCFLFILTNVLQLNAQMKTPSFITKVNFDIKKSEIINKLNIVKVERFLPQNFDKTGKTDYTVIIQNVIDKYQYIEFPDFPLLINDKGLKIKSNSVLVFNKNSKLFLSPSNKSSYDILNIYGKENVIIFSPTIVGDRNTHNGNSGEWGMGISIRSSKNITIINPNISNCWGDGIYLGTVGNVPNFNVVIEFGVINNNRRNGISVVSIDKLKISNLIISNTNGISPQVGIDFEPNNVKDLLKNITLSNLYTYNNKFAGIFVNTTRFIAPNKVLDISLDNIRDEKSKYGLGYVSDSKFSSSKITGKMAINNFSKDDSKNQFHSSKKAKNDKVVVELNKSIVSF